MLKIKWIVNTIMLYAGMIVWFYASVAIVFGYKATHYHFFSFLPVGAVVAAFLLVGLLVVNRDTAVRPVSVSPPPVVTPQYGPQGELLYLTINEVVLRLGTQYDIRIRPLLTVGLINAKPDTTYKINLIRLRASHYRHEGYDRKELVEVLELVTNEHGCALCEKLLDLSEEKEAAQYFYYAEQEELDLRSYSNCLYIY